MPSRLLLISAIVIASLTWIAPASLGKVFYSLDEVQGLAFPGATRVEELEFFLTADQRAAIEELSKERLETDFVTAFAGYRAGQLIGYAFIETHQVRTLPETFLVVLGKGGVVTNTHVLAFYEPLEYLPTDRWREQYQGKRLAADLRVGDRIAGITGATLTAEAINGGIRRAMAIHFVLIEGQ